MNVFSLYFTQGWNYICKDLRCILQNCFAEKACFVCSTGLYKNLMLDFINKRSKAFIDFKWFKIVLLAAINSIIFTASLLLNLYTVQLLNIYDQRRQLDILKKDAIISRNIAFEMVNLQRGVGQLSKTNYSWVMKVFIKSVVMFFGQNKYTNIRRFWTIFCHKTRILASKNHKKIQFWVKWLHNIYLAKASGKTLSLFTKNNRI